MKELCRSFLPAKVFLPRSTDMSRYSVVACDQYTSDAEYWKRVEEYVGDAPSTLRLMLPEIYLEAPDCKERVERVHQTMKEYLDAGVLVEQPEQYIYVERTLPDGTVRHGIVGRVDLEQYDYTPGSTPHVRVTEGTITSRIPPRQAVRRGASLELPHVLLLIDDPERTVVEPLEEQKFGFKCLYDFELMERGGHIRGWAVPAEVGEKIAAALEKLGDAEQFCARYGMPEGTGVLQIAVGDGNHSLATARAHYLEVTKGLSDEERLAHPARWALAELGNVHDESLVFEAIHRAIFDTNPEALMDALVKANPGAYLADEASATEQCFAYEYAGKSGYVVLPEPPSKLAVGSLQKFLDANLSKIGGKVDYIHGEREVREMGRRANAIAFILPAMGKDELYPTILHDGVLPRKTFSMGEADGKRYYLEARKITR